MALRKQKHNRNNDSCTRSIDPAYVKRAEAIDSQQLREYLDSSIVSLHQAVDSWRFRKGPQEDVTLCLDAIIAMWSVLERREQIDT